jgi:hypothetical protein
MSHEPYDITNLHSPIRWRLGSMRADSRGCGRPLQFPAGPGTRSPGFRVRSHPLARAALSLGSVHSFGEHEEMWRHRRGDRSLVRRLFLSPLRGFLVARRGLSQGLRPGLHTAAPFGAGKRARFSSEHSVADHVPSSCQNRRADPAPIARLQRRACRGGRRLNGATATPRRSCRRRCRVSPDRSSFARSRRAGRCRGSSRGRIGGAACRWRPRRRPGARARACR